MGKKLYVVTVGTGGTPEIALYLDKILQPAPDVDLATVEGYARRYTALNGVIAGSAVHLQKFNDYAENCPDQVAYVLGWEDALADLATSSDGVVVVVGQAFLANNPDWGGRSNWPELPEEPVAAAEPEATAEAPVDEAPEPERPELPFFLRDNTNWFDERE